MSNIIETAIKALEEKLQDKSIDFSAKFEIENEGSIVVDGIYMNDGRFIANKVLAKHDENYMPPEVIKSLKETGKWQE